jgi:hypothetical protein
MTKSEAGNTRNPKPQALSSREDPNTLEKSPFAGLVWNLALGASLELGIWNLEF